MVQKINDNACRLELPIEYGVTLTFNMCDLILFIGDDKQEREDIKMDPFQEGGSDGGPSKGNIGPLARVIVRRIQEEEGL